MKAELKLNGIFYEVDITEEQAKQIEGSNEKLTISEKERDAVLKTFNGFLGNIREIDTNIRAAVETLEKVESVNGEIDIPNADISTLLAGISVCVSSGLKNNTDEPLEAIETAKLCGNVSAKISRYMLKSSENNPWGRLVGTIFSCGCCAP